MQYCQIRKVSDRIRYWEGKMVLVHLCVFVVLSDLDLRCTRIQFLESLR